MISRPHQYTVKIESFDQIGEKIELPTVPAISIRSQEQIHQYQMNPNGHEYRLYTSTNQEKVIPGYNFESLFRKKSHIRLARKKNKEQAQKKSCNTRVENSEKQAKNIQKGHWTPEENKMYHWFLEIHNRHFILKHLRRTDKIFKSMASFIRTREAEQCRSHHQKMQKKYHNFYQILLKSRIEFYNTANPDQLKNQLQQNGYDLKECVLISEQQLKNGDSVKSEYQYEEIKSEHSARNSIEDDQSSSKLQNSLMGEDYEKGLEFKLKFQ